MQLLYITQILALPKIKVISADTKVYVYPGFEGLKIVRVGKVIARERVPALEVMRINAVADTSRR